MEINLKNDISTLKKLQKWTKSVLYRISKHSEKIVNRQNYPKISKSERITNQNTLKPIEGLNPLTKMAENISKNQSINEKPIHIDYQFEEHYEHKYKRNYYDVILHGNGLSEFTNIYERIDEIKRCTGVRSPEIVRPIVEKKSKINKLFIRVKTYLEYKALTKNWPLDSFKTGVKVYPKMPKLQVVVLDVNRKLKVNHDNMEIKKLRDIFGLCNLKRIHTHNNKPCNKLIATCNSISAYIHVLKYGIHIGCKKHLVLPNIINYRLCTTCGSLNHQQKDCTKKQRCLKCAGYGHRIETCKSKSIQCLNCTGIHKCFSDKCPKFSKKKLYINRFILKILSGENLISNNCDILQHDQDIEQEQNATSNKTECRFDDEIESILSIKLNSYESKIIEYEAGLFGLGKEYQDKCDNDNCMALLSIQMFVLLLIKPFPTFLLNFVWPWLQIKIKRVKMHFQTKNIGVEKNESKKKSSTDIQIINEQIVSAYIASEKNKSQFDETINQEYTQKVILYGYIMLFACSFSLGPLILLLVNVVDLRVDGYRLLWLFRRPIGFKAQDIGAWFSIIRFLNVVGIVSNAFIIAFTSNWSKYFLKGTLENRLIFVVAFEHVVFVIWLTIIILYPDTPQSISTKIRSEAKMVKRIISNAKSSRHNSEKLEFVSKLTQTQSFKKQNILNASKRNTEYNSEEPDNFNDVFADTNMLEKCSPKNKHVSDSIKEEKENIDETKSESLFNNDSDIVFENETTIKRKKRTKKYTRLISQINPVK